MHMTYSQGRVCIVGGPKPSVGYAEVKWLAFGKDFVILGKRVKHMQLFCTQLGYPEGLKSFTCPIDDTIYQYICYRQYQWYW